MAIFDMPRTADSSGLCDFSFPDLVPLKPMAPQPAAKRILDKPTGDLEDFYELGCVLGSGHSGVVRCCRHLETGEAYACKTVEKRGLRRPSDVKGLRREIAIMRRLSPHPNIVRLQDVFEDDASVHIVQELCAGGELFDAITAARFFSEADAAAAFRGAVAAVAHCHAAGVMHRDLKPENLLLGTTTQSAAAGGDPRPTLKLCDFGLALELREGEEAEGLAGSPFYMAPEVILGRYDRAADAWSLGVVLFILLCGVPPFWGESERKTFQAIVRGQLSFAEPAWRGVSLEAKCLVRKLLSADPARRPTVEALLVHPWVRKHAPPTLAAPLVEPAPAPAPSTTPLPTTLSSAPVELAPAAQPEDRAAACGASEPARGGACEAGGAAGRFAELEAAAELESSSSRSSAGSSSWTLSPRGPLDSASDVVSLWWPGSPSSSKNVL